MALLLVFLPLDCLLGVAVTLLAEKPREAQEAYSAVLLALKVEHSNFPLVALAACLVLVVLQASVLVVLVELVVLVASEVLLVVIPIHY